MVLLEAEVWNICPHSAYHPSTMIFISFFDDKEKENISETTLHHRKKKYEII